MSDERALILASIQKAATNPLKMGDVPVILLEQVDTWHGLARDTAGRNFRRNRHRFEEGKHYFSRPVKEVRQLSDAASGNSPSGPTRGNPDIEMILLTKRGYVLLTKSLDDDLAWDIYEYLVEFYFDAVAKGVVEASSKWHKQKQDHTRRGGGKPSRSPGRCGQSGCFAPTDAESRQRLPGPLW